MNLAEFDPDRTVDATDCVLGRVASRVAERALDGERVAVVNAERAVVTGSEESVMEKYRTRAGLGSDKGPAHPKRPDTVFKRAVRGMIPHKTERGREAFENVRVYVGNPHEFDAERVEDASIDRLSTIRFVHLGEISEQLGARKTW